jgi:hypothetical protein
VEQSLVVVRLVAVLEEPVELGWELGGGSGHQLLRGQRDAVLE